MISKDLISEIDHLKTKFKNLLILQTVLICVLLHTLLTCRQLKLMFRLYIYIKLPLLLFKEALFSGLQYKYKCGGCSATYYGKTKSHFKV